MKSTIVFLSFIILFLTSYADWNNFNKTVEASGPDLTATLATDKVREIDAHQAIIVNYTVGTPVSVTYTVPESLSQYLEITCHNGKLKCKFQEGINVKFNGRQVVVNVTAPKVDEYEASSSAKINVSGLLTIDKLKVDASSAASIMFASVSAHSAELEASSSAMLLINELTSRSVGVDASSNASINLDGSLGNVDIEASSSATVKISGACNILKVDASSGASVNAAEAKISTGNIDASSAASVTVSEAIETPYKTTKNSGGQISIR